MKKIKPTNENLRRFGVKLLMQWLIIAAKEKTTVIYHEVKDRLEQECGFTKKEHPEKWKKIVKLAAREVYNYPHWGNVYEEIFGEN